MGIISIIFPVLMMMVLGKILGMKGILDDHTVGSLKKLIADIMLPVTLFDAILQTAVNRPAKLRQASIGIRRTRREGRRSQIAPFDREPKPVDALVRQPV